QTVTTRMRATAMIAAFARNPERAPIDDALPGAVALIGGSCTLPENVHGHCARRGGEVNSAEYRTTRKNPSVFQRALPEDRGEPRNRKKANRSRGGFHRLED